MDAEEKLRWKALYASYPDEMILEMLSQDPGSYREGAYDLLPLIHILAEDVHVKVFVPGPGIRIDDWH
jgi:hypothetical protein